MTFDCKLHCQRCIVCNRGKADRRGGVALQPLGIPEYPWEIVGIDYVADLPKSGIDGYTSVFIMVSHLTKMTHFTPCHKEIITEESAYLFINHMLSYVIDYMVFLRSLYLIEILSLLGNSGRHSWES